MSRQESVDARGRLTIGLKRFLDKYPLFGAIAATWLVREDLKTKTMGVCFGERELRVILFYRPQFVLSLPWDELMGVLLHEVRHITYRHVFLDPTKYPDKHALLVATEVTVNERMPERLPRGVILLNQFPQLPADENTDQRYQRMANPSSDPTDEQNGGADSKQNMDEEEDGGDEQCGGMADDETEPDDADSPAEARESQQPATRDDAQEADSRHNAKNLDKDDDSASENGSDDEVPVPLETHEIDDHSRWDSIRAHETLVNNDVDNAVEAGAQSDRPLSDEEQRFLDRFLADSNTAWREVLLPTGTPRHVNWAKAMQVQLGRSIARVSSYARPPRRFQDLIGVCPGSKYVPAKPTVLVIVETHTMTQDQIRLVCCELRHIEPHVGEAWIVEAERAMWRLSKFLQDAPRRPTREQAQPEPAKIGLSTRYALDPIFLNEVNPELILYFTDGSERITTKAPQTPLIWAILPGGRRPAPWGGVVRMSGN